MPLVRIGGHRRRWVLLLAGWTIVSIGSAAGADHLTGPPPNHREVAKIVAQLAPQAHLKRQAIDDTISERAMLEFIKGLDPMKAYFTRSDIEEFSKMRHSLDDEVSRGDLSFAYRVFNRYLDRVDQRVALVQELLDGELDFDQDELMTIEPKELEYPLTEDQIRDRWRKRVKYDLLMLERDEKDMQKARDRLRRRYVSFDKRMKQTDGDELLEMYLTAITSSIDPHTTYMSPNSLNNFRILMRLNLEGIGAALQVVDGYTTITKVIPGGAASLQTQLKAEDRIVSVGQGEDGEMVDVVDLKLTDVVKLIRGPQGTVVRLGTIPAAGVEANIVRIVREKVNLTDSEARGVVMEEGQKPDGAPYRVGVIDLPSFYMDMEGAKLNSPDYKSTTRDVRRLLEQFTSAKVDAVVLDLRQNGGGSLTEAIDLTGLFIDFGPIVQVKGFNGRVDTYRDLERGVSWAGPLVVLTSKFSASASEILAGAVQDYRRGIVVGDRATHGKGTVQSLMEIGAEMFQIDNPPNLGALKITMQQFYRPGGQSTQKRGVLADIELPSISTHMDIGEADLDYAIEFDQVPRASFREANMTSVELNQWLGKRSQGRIAESEDFGKLQQDIERYRQRKNEKTVSLKKEEFLRRLAEFDVQKEEEKQLDEESRSEDEIIQRDFYFNEVLAITADYVSALDKSREAYSQGRRPTPSPQR